MSRAYASPLEHLDDQLALVGLLVERQITAHWEHGILPRAMDQFSGTFVGGGEVKALLGGGQAPSDAGATRLADLDAALADHGERIEGRLAASRAEGAVVPWDGLRRAFALTPTEQRALLVLAAVEISARLRQLMRYLVNEANRVHADVGLLELLVYGAPATRGLLITELAPDARLLSHRLIEIVGTRRQADEAPYLLRPLKVARRVIELLHGVVRLDPALTGVAELVSSPSAPELLLSEPDLERTAQHLLAAPGGPAVVLVGPEGSGRKSLCYRAARAAGCGVLRIRCAELPEDGEELSRTLSSLLREAVLLHAIPVLEELDALAPEDGRSSDRPRRLDNALAAYLGPLAATAHNAEGHAVPLTRGSVRLTMGVPSEGNRQLLWQRALPEASPELDLARVAGRYPVTGGVIERAAAAARALAAAAGRPVGPGEVHVGLRDTFDEKLSALGTRVLRRQRWDDVVLPEDTMDGLKEFIARARFRRRVYDDWGFARKLAKGLGLSALFSGPPGTGKTMVAGIIADELGLDLYQIDLSRIVSKYVGETEKNLGQVFDAAETGHSILLFDEADSLFAKRGEVKSSVDRYANLEVNYLLQRMEQFSGVSILTTNLESSIDTAFKRRLAFKLDFPMPEKEERARLWAAMLPAEAPRADNIDFELLSRKFEMSGGYIRNAVLRAAFLAASEDSHIDTRHLKRAADLEYASMGKVV